MIRRSHPGEAETLFQVQRDACTAAFAHVFPPELYPFPDEAVRRRWRAFDGTVLVAERDGSVVGLAGVRDCELAGCAEARLWTLEENHRARRFYEKRGWRPNGETRVVPFPPNPLDVGYSFRRESPSP